MGTLSKPGAVSVIPDVGARRLVTFANGDGSYSLTFDVTGTDDKAHATTFTSGEAAAWISAQLANPTNAAMATVKAANPTFTAAHLLPARQALFIFAEQQKLGFTPDP